MPHWSLLSSWLFLATPRKRNVGRHYRLDDLYSKIKDVATRCGFFSCEKISSNKDSKGSQFCSHKNVTKYFFLKRVLKILNQKSTHLETKSKWFQKLNHKSVPDNFYPLVNKMYCLHFSVVPSTTEMYRHFSQ